MASIGKCARCGVSVLSDQRKCPSCGAPNENYVEHRVSVPGAPRTVHELLEYCLVRGMPLQKMRFFIGEDFREPCAFGIFRDQTDWVVYKNKADGSRFERYRGKDESAAVMELFAKLLDECHQRGIILENFSPA